MLDKKILPLAVLIPSLIFIVTCLGLSLTITYPYFGELIHYHTDNCYINNCTITPVQCCTKSLLKGIRCRNCYDVDINYTLSLITPSALVAPKRLNDKNYTKYGHGNVDDESFCNKNSLLCYYDDRNTQDSLRLWLEYSPDNGVIGIVILSVFLFFVAIFMLISTSIYFRVNKEDNKYR